jgi:hypothetical protein
MSCLAFIPALELSTLELLALDCRSHSRLVQCGTPQAHRIAVPFDSTQILPYVAVNKDAFPNSPADGAGCLKSFRLPKQAQVFRVIFQAQYQAFVRFAVGSSAALIAIALKWTCVLEPFTRGGLSL